MSNEQPAQRGRLVLADLLVWVLGAALISDLGRRAWADREVKDGSLWVAYWSPLYQLALFLVPALVVVVALRLGMQAVRVIKGGFDPLPGRRGLAVGWRFGAIVTLVVLAWAGFWVIRPYDPEITLGWRVLDQFRRALVPLCALLALCGVLAGMQEPAPWSKRRASEALIGAPLALVVGVGLVAGFMATPHLVLIAVEAVRIAMHHLPDPRPALAVRIRTAALPAGLTLAACLAAATWLSRGLRRSARGERAFSPSGSVALGLLLLAAVAGSAYLIVRTLPAIHETIDVGLSMLLSSFDVAVVAAGFVGLGAGIVARACGRGDVPARRGWLGQLALVLVALVLFVLAGTMIERDAPGYRVLAWTRLVAPSSRLGLTEMERLWERLWEGELPLGLVGPPLAWAAWETLRLCGPWAPDRRSAFDAALTADHGPVRLLALAVAIAILALATLPALFIAGLAVYQWRVVGLHGP